MANVVQWHGPIINTLDPADGHPFRRVEETVALSWGDGSQAMRDASFRTRPRAWSQAQMWETLKRIMK